MTTPATRTGFSSASAWLARLRHDVLKHALWRARDLLASRQSGVMRAGLSLPDRDALRRGLVDLRDDEGEPATALALYAAHRRAPAALGADGALDAFEAVLRRAQDLVHGDDGDAALEAVLALEPALDRLAAALRSGDSRDGRT